MTAGYTSLVRVMLWVTFASALSGCMGSTFQTAATRSDSVPAFLLQGSGVSGSVPVVYVLEEGRRQEVITGWPSRPDPVGLTVDTGQGLAWSQVIIALELATGWVYDQGVRSFVEGSATHSVDGPDAAGRAQGKDRLTDTPRAMVAVGVRFVRVNGSVSEVELSGGGAFKEIWASAPAGANLSWSSVSEQSYERGVVDPANPTETVVRTDRVMVPAGVQLSAIAARLPGGVGRIDGQVTISAFTGRSIDRVVVTVPLQGDIPRFKWCKIFRSSALDASGRLSFKALGLDLSGSGDDVEVWMRVE